MLVGIFNGVLYLICRKDTVMGERTYGGRATRSSVSSPSFFVVRLAITCNSWPFQMNTVTSDSWADVSGIVCASRCTWAGTSSACWTGTAILNWNMFPA
jgi:hypothetical protein